MELLNVEELIKKAERSTGLTNWGGSDFLEPFRILITSINEQGGLTPQGLERTHLHLDNLLSYRLRLFEDRSRRPEIAEQEIREPIFMSGLPRTGSSYLNALLTCDPRHLGPMHWQMWCPSPPPNDPDIDHSAEIARAKYLMAAQDFQSQDLRDKHAYGVLQVEEDSHIDEYGFLCGAFTAWWDAPAYMQFMASADYTPTYVVHRKVLQALQVGAQGTRWVLKSPGHVMHLRSVIAVYPDASFVINHRDPATTLASGMSLMAAHRRQFGNRPLEQDRQFAVAFMESFARGLEDMAQLRRDPEMNRKFVDVHYLDLERDPLAEVEKVYLRLGERLMPETRAAMSNYIAANRKGKFGRHVYRLSDYDLSSAEVHDRFSDYIRQFDIRLER
jgi:hypothetical protein